MFLGFLGQCWHKNWQSRPNERGGYLNWAQKDLFWYLVTVPLRPTATVRARLRLEAIYAVAAVPGPPSGSVAVPSLMYFEMGEGRP